MSPCILYPLCTNKWPLDMVWSQQLMVTLSNGVISCLSMPYVTSDLAWRINEWEHNCPVLMQ